MSGMYNTGRGRNGSETGTAASITRLGGYRLCLLPGVGVARWTEGTAAGIYDIRRLRNNPCTGSFKGPMQGLPVALFSGP